MSAVFFNGSPSRGLEDLRESWGAYWRGMVRSPGVLVYEDPEGSSAPPEALAPGDPHFSRDVPRLQLPDVPEEQDATIGVVDPLHAPAELCALVEGFQEILADAVGQTASPPGPAHL
jgi:hypothetical protein